MCAWISPWLTKIADRSMRRRKLVLFGPRNLNMNLTVEAFNILLLLLPGFLSGQLFYTVFGPCDVAPTKRTLDALMFSFVIYLLVSVVVPWEPLATITSSKTGLGHSFTSNKVLIGTSLFFVLMIPLFFGYTYHQDYFHAVLRKMKITTKSSRQSTWSDAFLAEDRHVIVTLKDGRRVRGYPSMVSTDTGDGFVYLFNPAWVNDNKTSEDDPDYIESYCHGFLLNRENISIIEFILEEGESLEQYT